MSTGSDIDQGLIKLTEAEIYEFDVRGYFVIPGFLSQGEVSRMNNLIDAHHSAHKTSPPLFAVLPVGDPFWDLMTHPKVLDIARYWCGDRFRVDHIYGFQRPPAGTPGEPTNENLHAGPWANQGLFQYNWFGGKSRVGLLVFGLILEPAGPNDGGLVIVPGSHKGELPLEGKEVWTKLSGQSHANRYTMQPILDAGDMVVFSESLVHGTSTWKNKQRRRRNLYYKYCPGHMCWRNYEEWGRPMQQLAKTDLQRSLLRPPYVAGYDEDEVTMFSPNRWKTPTGV